MFVAYGLAVVAIFFLHRRLLSPQVHEQATPLVLCGALKILYDLAIWQSFRKIKPGH